MKSFPLLCLASLLLAGCVSRDSEPLAPPQVLTGPFPPLITFDRFGNPERVAQFTVSNVSDEPLSYGGWPNAPLCVVTDLIGGRWSDRGPFRFCGYGAGTHELGPGQSFTFRVPTAGGGEAMRVGVWFTSARADGPGLWVWSDPVPVLPVAIER